MSFCDGDGRLKVGSEARQFIESSVIHPEHLDAINQATIKGNFAISFREAGAPTLAALGRGAAAKGHNILEKTIKPGSVNKAYGKAAAGILTKVRSANLEGYVGHWENNKITGIWVHNVRIGIDEIFDLDINKPGDLAKFKLQVEEYKNIVPYTGDYDVHDIILFHDADSGIRRKSSTPSAGSFDDNRVKDTINERVAKVDSARPFHKEHMNVQRHGAQAQFPEHMMTHEFDKVLQHGGYVSAVANAGEFPIGFINQGKYLVIENINELNHYYMQSGAKPMSHWTSEDPLIETKPGLALTKSHHERIRRESSGSTVSTASSVH